MDFKQKHQCGIDNLLNLNLDYYMKNQERIINTEKDSIYTLDRNSLKINKDKNDIFAYFEFRNKKASSFSCYIRFFEHGIFNVKISEIGQNEKKRNKNPINFNENMTSLQLSDITIQEDETRIFFIIKESKYNIKSNFSLFIDSKNSYIFEDLNKNFNEHKLEIIFEGLTFNYYINEHLISSINKTNKLNLESNYNEKEFSKENLSCCIDIISYDCTICFGLPERNSNFILSDTTEKTAYRLFNIDVFDQEANNNQNLYGSIPILHSISTNGKFINSFILNNVSETWVDLKTFESKSKKFKESVFTCESGILDFYLFADTSLQRNFYKQALVTGFCALPPLFSLGYHQCKYGYKSQKEIEDVNEKMDENGLPYDVIWVDIDHADEKKYFVWDKKNFPQMEKFVKKLEQCDRKLVTIIDPHLRINFDKKQIVKDEILATEPKVVLENKITEAEQINEEDNYHISELLLKEECVVLDESKKPFIGECWPGKSYWADFLNPKIQNLYNIFFQDESYFLNSNLTHTWIDMNEPAVFEQEEKTFPKNNLHFNGSNFIHHRDIHNLYGQLYHKTTQKALQNRYKNQKRVFVLSRSFYTGSQKFGFIWTGDNRANFDFLKFSVPLLQSICLTGISACGADVGGFFGEAQESLLKSWYAIGVFYPFFRGHCHYDSPNREPYLLSENIFLAVKDTILLRYQLLMYFYTKFFENVVSAEPLFKPVYLLDDFFEAKSAESFEDMVCRSAIGSFAFGNEFIVGSYYEKDEAAVKKEIAEFTGNDEKLIELLSEENVKQDNKMFENLHSKKTEDRFEFLYISQRILDNYVLYDFKTDTKITNMNDIANLNEKLREDKTAIYLVKGGSIIPFQKEIKQSSANNLKQNISIRIYVDLFKRAKGTLYLDDGETFKFKQGDFIYSQFYFNENNFTFSFINLNEMKSKENYLVDSEYKKIKFSEITVIGTDLSDEYLNSNKLQLRNLSTGEKFVINKDEDLKLIKSSELNKTLVIENLEKFNLFVFQDFEIIALNELQ